jgi:hypothetical protein
VLGVYTSSEGSEVGGGSAAGSASTFSLFQIGLPAAIRVEGVSPEQPIDL